VLIWNVISSKAVKTPRAGSDISEAPARLSELILPGCAGRMLRLPTA
jgi:hypothetical protein